MRIGKATIAHGKTLEEALEKAASLLNAPIDRLAYTVLSDGRGVNALFKLRAECVAPPPDDTRKDPFDVLDNLESPWTVENIGELSPKDFLYELHRASHTPAPADSEEEADTPAEETVREIEHDIGIGFGSFDHVGDLVIRGSVTYGVTIRATGSVTIDGDIDSAYVDCAKDLDVKGGILGTARSRQGGVACHYAHAAYIVSGQRISIRESSVHSNLIAGVEIEVGDAIVGGHSYAQNILWARAVGSEAGVRTVLVAGRNRALRDRMEEIRVQSALLAERLTTCNRTIEQLQPMEESGNYLHPEERIALWTAVAQKGQLGLLAIELSEERARIISQIDREKTARVKIRDRVYPNTTIEIDDGAMEIRAITHFATFSKDYETGAIRVTPYS